jgi:hypothetical protein
MLCVFSGTQITEFAKSTARGVAQDSNQTKNAFVKRSFGFDRLYWLAQLPTIFPQI